MFFFPERALWVICSHVTLDLDEAFSDVTLITILTLNRKDRLPYLMSRWKHRINMALFLKEEEIPQVDKDRKKEYGEQLEKLRKEKQAVLEEYGKENKIVGQLIDLALLANGLLKGEALNRFVKRSVELIG